MQPKKLTHRHRRSEVDRRAERSFRPQLFYDRRGDMIVGVEIENGPCDPDHARSFRGGLSTKS